MKWIRRKPSWKAHRRVAFWCFVFLGTAPYPLIISNPGHLSGISRLILGGGKPGIIGHANSEYESYRVVETDGQLVVLTKKDAGYEALDADPNSLEMWYLTGTYKVGFWAPTRLLDAKLLAHGEQIFGTGGGPARAPSMERILEVQAALVAHEGLDPRLATEQHIADSTMIWTGFIINAAFLLAIGGLVWSIAWVPARVRDQRRERRAEAGLCPMCAYDLKATPSLCPECGWGREVGT